MAYMIPDTVPRKATAGERLLYHTFKKYLPDDYIVYYEPNIQGRKPDFVVIGPDIGVLILEVKDYTEHTLYQLNQEEWWIYTKEGRKEKVISPYQQAREYAFLVTNLLKRDKNLLQSDDLTNTYLKFSYASGVVFTRMKQTHLVKHELHRIIRPEVTLTREEIDPGDELFSQEHLMEKLTGMFRYRKNYRLTEQDITAIRYHLFPEVRISGEVQETAYYNDQVLLTLHNLKAMDLYQELLAKQLGDKHRLIRGVAGSGKTLILASRAKLLKQRYPEWRILVLCYGVPLYRTLKCMIEQGHGPEGHQPMMPQSVERKDTVPIVCSTFHEWLKKDFHVHHDKEISHVLQRIESGQMKPPQYDAILIDESQDFEESWMRLVVAALNPDTQSLLLVEDKAQNIFKRSPSISQKVGLDFRGRSKVLTVNYRNTAEIATFAWEFYREHSRLQCKISNDDTADIIPPQCTKRKGPMPFIRSFASFPDEARWVADVIHRLTRKPNISFSDIAILYRVKNSKGVAYVDLLRDELAQHHIPVYWITKASESKREYNPEDNSVKVCTLDSAKGLDFKAVFIVNIDNLPFYREESEETEVSRLYIGMTRATEYLFLTYSGQSAFTPYFDAYAEGKKS
ncbi:NERD domain-containing protein [Paenibacillus thiaminolyticus]|uniref:3'-5' exonuclease n=1 Tax=Paenibacillus thiaminolyticus TaxID=49283 RepID=UPI002330155F|nr:3'-5' exonuclease [Paenibacillus thiaminolyticus]WCF09352.1 NERD domain-containing protein [Paenibacillus thiaminolyticus]WII38571.1 NERD domain-containing protein [Paenibacillus thiaminolyticus]